MIFSTIEKVLFGAFLIVALVAAPVQDYDTQSYYLAFGLTAYARTIAVAFAVILALWIAYLGIRCLRADEPKAACVRFVVAAAAPISLANFSGASDFVGLAAVLATFLAPVALVLGVPVWAATQALQASVRRDGTAFLQYIAVPLLGACLFFAGRGISDAIAVRTFAPLFTPAPAAITAHAIGGPLFMASYVVYDGGDDNGVDETRRLATVLDYRDCHVDSRQIGRHYYIATEAC